MRVSYVSGGEVGGKGRSGGEEGKGGSGVIRR